MNTIYLGQVPVDISTHPEFRLYTPMNWAMYFLERYGQIDGEHHKAWVLDQIARVVHGTKVICERASWSDGQTEDRIWLDEPSQEYLTWRDGMLAGDDGDEHDYDYYEGIAP
jgi:hypothetical protein